MRPGAAAARPTPVDDQDTRLMIETLEHGLSDPRGQPVRIRAIRRELLPSLSSFRRERLRLTLENNSTLRVFLKDLNPDHQTEKAQAVRARDLAPSSRELRMYQSVLSPERFGTLRLYAYRWDAERRLFWIFLEDGGRMLLHNFVDMDRWTAAARWAARFHAAGRSLGPAPSEFLACYDHAHYRACAERVVAILPNLQTPERELVERGLRRYARHVDRLAALPRTVIHGQFFGRNVMLRRGTGERRIVVIDWETAALGPGTFDLVSLTSGKWTDDERQAMRVAYFEQLQAETGQPLEWEAFCRELALVALYQSLEWLAWWGRHRALSRGFATFRNELTRVLDDPSAPDG
jgi:hypothetical protein